MAYRKSIRIHGKEKKSPAFKRKADVDNWYNEQYRLKQFIKDGTRVPIDSNTTFNEYFFTKWLENRKKSYPKSTWGSDEQRFSDYVKSEFGSTKVHKVNQLQIRLALKKVVEVHGRSIQTRNRVRSLISKIFNDAMNEDPPLRVDNPALNISFQDPRVGTPEPEHIRGEKAIVAFIKAAKEIGPRHYVYACICSHGWTKEAGNHCA